MRVYVGTSGWAYFWNPDGLDWYMEHTGLKAVELNASFYRFPFRNQVRSWARKSAKSGLRWAVKVHRSITHIRMLNERAKEIWNKFAKLMEDLDPFVDFYLLQLPPRARPTKPFMERLEGFISYADLGWRLAVEFRNHAWFNAETVDWLRELQTTFVSVDSPEAIFYSRSGPYTYLRLHGRTAWYAHYYSREELFRIARELISLDGDAIYAFFNNDHGMLENAIELMKIIEELRRP